MHKSSPCTSRLVGIILVMKGLTYHSRRSKAKYEDLTEIHREFLTCTPCTAALQLPPFGKSAFASAPRCACSAAPVSTCRPCSRVPRLGTRLGGLRLGGVAVSASPLSSWRCSGTVRQPAKVQHRECIPAGTSTERSKSNNPQDSPENE